MVHPLTIEPGPGNFPGANSPRLISIPSSLSFSAMRISVARSAVAELDWHSCRHLNQTSRSRRMFTLIRRSGAMVRIYLDQPSSSLDEVNQLPRAVLVATKLIPRRINSFAVEEHLREHFTELPGLPRPTGRESLR